MQKFKSYFISLVAVAMLVNAVTPFLPNEILPKELETKTAQAATFGPSIQVKVRDIGCSQQERTSWTVSAPGGTATATDENAKDIDCAAINLIAGNTSTTNPVQSIYSYDFRLGISLAESESGCTSSQGAATYTNWASQGTPNVETTMTSSTTYGGGGMVAADCVRVWYETRAMPAGKAIRNVRLGIKVGGGAMQYTPNATAGGGWSAFSQTGDFTTAQVALVTTAINVPDDADYVSTTIPQNATAQYPNGNPSGSTMGVLSIGSAQNYSITMKNQGGIWDTDSTISRNLASADPAPPGNNCDNWQPTAANQTCVENRVMTSTQYKLRRIDSNTSAIQTTAGDLPYNKTVQYSYRSQEIIEYLCPEPPPTEPCPDGPGEPGFPENPEILNQRDDNSIFGSLFKTANAAEACPGDVPPEPAPCTEMPTGTYTVVGPIVSPSEDVAYDESATFPLSLTATQAGDYQLRFQMVRVSNNTVFGNPATNPETIAVINVRAGNPWSFPSCGVNQVVTKGTIANYNVAASVPSGYNSNINVTMASSPAGPAMQTSPVVLNSSNTPIPYSATAMVPTGNLTVNQLYTLTFTATDGSFSTTCTATLTVTPLVATVDLKFNNSDNPPSVTPPTSTGTLSWTTANAASCTGSMQQGADTSSPAWSGARAAANSGAQTFNVTGLQPNTTYTFHIVCVNQYGEAGTPDTVQVTVNSAPLNPTADLKCQGAGDSSPQDGPCSVPYNSPAVLTWSSTSSTSCTLTPDFPSIGTSETSGRNTPNLTANRTYTLTCNGAAGTNPDTDTVDINITDIPPYAAVQVNAATPSCGVINITWRNGTGSQNPQFYRVYHNTTGNDADFVQIGSDVPYNSTVGYVYSYTHNNPAGASNYYAVAAWNGISRSAYTYASTYPIAPTPCSADISLSDKDILSVGTYTNPADVICSGEHEVIPADRIFKSGDKVTYRINVCNAGTQNFTNVTVTDTLERLVNPTNFQYFPAGCDRQAPSISGSNITFYLDDIVAPANPANPTACAITFDATVQAPAGSPSALYRFRNSAVVNTAQANKTLNTPYYLFSLGAGVPDRTETAP